MELLLVDSQEKIIFGSVLEGIFVFILGMIQICYLKRLLETKTVI